MNHKIKKFNEFINESDGESIRDREVAARIKVQKAILWITINRGFFGKLLADLNIYGSSKLNPETMATNGTNIIYHPNFVLSQSDGAVRFVLCHEVLHCVADHMTRRGGRNPLMWNFACDYAINPLLDAETDGGRDSNFAWPKNEDGSRMGLYESKYVGMKAEVIYEDLLSDKKQQQKAKDSGEMDEVHDSTEDLPTPDSEGSVAQRSFDDQEDSDNSSDSDSEDVDTDDSGGDSGDGDSDDDSGDSDSEDENSSSDSGDDSEDEDSDDSGDSSGNDSGDSDSGDENSGSDSGDLIGKQIQITEGPNAGKTGTVVSVNDNGDVEITLD